MSGTGRGTLLLLFTVVALAMPGSAMGQVNLGFALGLNSGGLSGDAPPDVSYTGKTGLLAYVVADIPVADDVWISVQPGYSARGTGLAYKVEGEEEPRDSLALSADYVSVPRTAEGPGWKQGLRHRRRRLLLPPVVGDRAGRRRRGHRLQGRPEGLQPRRRLRGRRNVPDRQAANHGGGPVLAEPHERRRGGALRCDRHRSAGPIPVHRIPAPRRPAHPAGGIMSRAWLSRMRDVVALAVALAVVAPATAAGQGVERPPQDEFKGPMLGGHVFAPSRLVANAFIRTELNMSLRRRQGVRPRSAPRHHRRGHADGPAWRPPVRGPRPRLPARHQGLDGGPRQIQRDRPTGHGHRGAARHRGYRGHLVRARAGCSGSWSAKRPCLTLDVGIDNNTFTGREPAASSSRTSSRKIRGRSSSRRRLRFSGLRRRPLRLGDQRRVRASRAPASSATGSRSTT